MDIRSGIDVPQLIRSAHVQGAGRRHPRRSCHGHPSLLAHVAAHNRELSVPEWRDHDQRLQDAVRGGVRTCAQQIRDCELCASVFEPLLSTWRHLLQDGGILRFYRGVGPALIQGPMSRFGDTAANAGTLALLDSYDATSTLPVGKSMTVQSTATRLRTGVVTHGWSGLCKWRMLLPILFPISFVTALLESALSGNTGGRQDGSGVGICCRLPHCTHARGRTEDHIAGVVTLPACMQQHRHSDLAYF